MVDYNDYIDPNDDPGTDCRKSCSEEDERYGLPNGVIPSRISVLVQVWPYKN